MPDSVKQTLCASVDAMAPELLSVSREIHANPELAFQETRAAALLVGMGNVSHRLPSIHPMLAAAPPDVVIHNPEFAKYAGSEMGDQAALDGAKSLAMTAYDFLAETHLQADAKRAFAIAKGLAS